MGGGGDSVGERFERKDGAHKVCGGEVTCRCRLHSHSEGPESVLTVGGYRGVE